MLRGKDVDRTTIINPKLPGVALNDFGDTLLAIAQETLFAIIPKMTLDKIEKRYVPTLEYVHQN